MAAADSGPIIRLSFAMPLTRSNPGDEPMIRACFLVVPAVGLALGLAAARADLMKDSPVTFPEQGALPSKYPPDQPSKTRGTPEEGYSIFSPPQRLREQIDRMQAEMIQGEWSFT